MLTDDGHAPSGTGSFSISADKSYEGLYEINENAVNVQEAGTGIDSRRTAHKSDAIQNKKPACPVRLLTEHRQGDIKAVYVSAQLRREKKVDNEEDLRKATDLYGEI